MSDSNLHLLKDIEQELRRDSQIAIRIAIFISEKESLQKKLRFLTDCTEQAGIFLPSAICQEPLRMSLVKQQARLLIIKNCMRRN